MFGDLACRQNETDVRSTAKAVVFVSFSECCSYSFLAHVRRNLFSHCILTKKQVVNQRKRRMQWAGTMLLNGLFSYWYVASSQVIYNTAFCTYDLLH